jgi:hypothetical protein
VTQRPCTLWALTSIVSNTAQYSKPLNYKARVDNWRRRACVCGCGCGWTCALTHWRSKEDAFPASLGHGHHCSLAPNGILIGTWIPYKAGAGTFPKDLWVLACSGGEESPCKHRNLQLACIYQQSYD